MSLINDALKRANQVPPPPPLPQQIAKGLQPVPARPPSDSRLALIIFPTILCLILAVAGYLLMRGFNSKDAAGRWRSPLQRVFARERPQPKAQPATEVGEETENAAAQHQAAVASVKLQKAIPSPVPAPRAAVTNVTPVVVVSTNPFPRLKIQGIFYRANNPSAMINAKTVFIGDWVSNAKVVGITQDSVTVEFEGQTKVLGLY